VICPLSLGAPAPGSPWTGLRPWGGALAFETWEAPDSTGLFTAFRMLRELVSAAIGGPLTFDLHAPPHPGRVIPEARPYPLFRLLGQPALSRIPMHLSHRVGPLIWRRSFNVINDDHLNRFSLHFEPQAQLLLNGSKQRNGRTVGRGRTIVGGPLELEVIYAG